MKIFTCVYPKRVLPNDVLSVSFIDKKASSEYLIDAPAKSGVRVAVLYGPSVKALNRSAFFVLACFMAGCMEALRSAAPRSGTANSVWPVSNSLCRGLRQISNISETLIMPDSYPNSANLISTITRNAFPLNQLEGRL